MFLNIWCNSVFLCLGSSGVFTALPERRKVCFSQQVSLPPAVLRPPLPGEEEVQLVGPCWSSKVDDIQSGSFISTNLCVTF